MFGFGKKKEKVVEPDGYLGELNENQEKVLLAFKDFVASQGHDQNPWFIDTHLLKFCRARKFDLEKIQEMWTNYMGYREKYTINTIMGTPEHELSPRMRELYPNGYCGIAKNGWPIYIERNGHIKVDDVASEIPEDVMLTIFAKSYEALQR